MEFLKLNRARLLKLRHFRRNSLNDALVDCTATMRSISRLLYSPLQAEAPKTGLLGNTNGSIVQCVEALVALTRTDLLKQRETSILPKLFTYTGRR